MVRVKIPTQRHVVIEAREELASNVYTSWSQTGNVTKVRNFHTALAHVPNIAVVHIAILKIVTSWPASLSRSTIP